MALQPLRNWIETPPYLEQMGWFNRILHHILGRVFQYRDIVKLEPDGGKWDGHPTVYNSLYLRRFYIIRKGSWKLFLHYIGRSDNDRHGHSHPWWFRSFCLSGGYSETIYLNDLDITQIEVEEFTPGQTLLRQAIHTHKVSLHIDKSDKEIPCWTLLNVGKAERVWDFLTENGRIPWYQYLDIPYSSEFTEDNID